MNLPLQRPPPFHVPSGDLSLRGFVHQGALAQAPPALCISSLPSQSPSLSEGPLPSKGGPARPSRALGVHTFLQLPSRGPEKSGDQRTQQQGQVSILLHRPRLIKPPDSQGDQTRPPASCWLKLAFKLPSLNFLSLSLPAASCPVTIYLLDLSLGALLLSLPLSFHQPMNFCFPPFPLVALSLSLASPTPTFSSPQHLSCSVLCSTRFKIYGPQTPSLT